MTMYRNGEHNPRNIYRSGIDRSTDEHVAVAFVPEFGRYAVRALNGYLRHSRAYESLDRIAEAHNQTTDAMGGVSGYCSECDRAHPCPTRRWATLSVSDPFNTTWEDDYPDDDTDDTPADADADPS